jgi:hypothetical protein
MEAANPDIRPEEQPTTQLRLIPPTEGGTWRLSGSTREVGRRGVAEARAALRAARRKDTERRRPSAA